MLVGPRHERQTVPVGAAAFAKLARYHRYYLGQGSDGRIPAGHVVAAVPVKGMETDHQLVIMIYRFEVSPTRFVIGPLQPAEHKGGAGFGRTHGVDELSHTRGLVGDRNFVVVVGGLAAVQPARPRADVRLIVKIEEHPVVGFEGRRHRPPKVGA